MYYPFLRAKQFELITLRELASEKETQDVIIPIFEPVKESYNNLTLAHKTFFENAQIAYLIVNPAIGEIPGDSEFYLKYLKLLEGEVFKPAFHYRNSPENNSNYIEECIHKYNLNDCMLICQNDIQDNDEKFRHLAVSGAISSFNVVDPGRNRSFSRYIISLGKTYIRLDDLFEKQARNSDFLDINEHRFSEEHIYYNTEGYQGFSDYTVLPSEFIDGGSTPRAVVIHLTYLNDENQIWIRHFTSESNDSIANVQGKFGEAAAKAVDFCRQRNLTNSAISELESYYDNQHYPGLGIVKKISIKNHLLILSKFLKNR